MQQSQFPRSPLCRSEAFTLIEIMVIVVIIGILAAVVIPRLGGQTTKARAKSTATSIRSIETAIGQFEINAGRFPTTEEGLKALVTRPSELEGEKWEGPYLPQMPQDGFGRAFLYREPGDNGRDYLLLSKGNDGQEGTRDDITNVPAEPAS